MEKPSLLPLEGEPHIFVHQRKELAELIGFETRNKYEVLDSQARPMGFVAEQRSGFMGAIARQILGHWRTFDLYMFNQQREKIAKAHHPFRFFFQRLDIYDGRDQQVAALQQRFSFFHKKFDLQDSRGQVVMQVKSPFWRLWTFIFKDNRSTEKARVEKKWSGLLKEAFTDTDNFKVTFTASLTDNNIRNAIALSTVFIDLQYFEKKPND